MITVETYQNSTNEVIKVIGVGGGGGNAVNRMIQSNIIGVEYLAVNTDQQALNYSLADTKLVIGQKLTKGLGAGANPEIGAKSAEESLDEIKKEISGSDMIFITAGMGGGTGTGAASIIAKAAKDMGILTIGIITKPFGFEGMQKMKKANKGIDELRESVDTLIVIPNDKILEMASKDLKMEEAFMNANEVLKQGVKGITDIIKVPGLINVDFADVKTTMLNKGVAHMGTGIAKGEGRAVEAAKLAINSPLLETSVKGASAILLNITASKDSLTISEFNEASMFITRAVENDNAEVIVGTAYSDEMEDYISVTVVATGFEEKVEEKIIDCLKAEVIEKVAEIEPIKETQRPEVEVMHLPSWLVSNKKY